MNKYLTKRNLSIAALVIIPLIIMITLGVYYSGGGCKTCNSVFTTPTPTPYATANPTSFPIQPSEDMQDIGYCSFGCGELIIGNGICDLMCNNEYCSYDGGDCD
jgi:hypothetical protein